MHAPWSDARWLRSQDVFGGAVGLVLRHRKALLVGYLLLLHTMFYLMATHRTHNTSTACL
jgi:hypothetical protein